MAASKVAIAEDSLLFKGTEAIEVLLAAGVKLMSASSVKNGIPGEAFYKDVTGTNGSLEIFNAVVAGISKLNEASEPGPYALLLSSEIYAESFLPLKGTLVTTADRINPLVTGGFYGTGTLKKASGLLVSLGGQSTTIYVGTDAITAFTQTDLSGYYQFRVFERIQYVVRDRKAIVTLKFGK